MQEKYTENIDKLDSFYQENLREASVEPPATLWDRISTSYSEHKKPKSASLRNRTLLLLLLLLLTSATGAFLYFGNGSSVNEETGTRSSEQKKKEVEVGNSGQETGNKKQEKKGAATVNNKKGAGNSQEKNETEIDSVSAVSPAVIETSRPVVEETKVKPDTVSIGKEIPKKKVSFREKHTQNIKADSLRPLFVPVK